MRIALATCRNLPPHEKDDAVLVRAFEQRGVEIALPAWDDPEILWSRFDACLIRTTWDYTERLPAYIRWVDRVAATLPLFNPAEVVRWNTHKSYLRDIERSGVAIIPTLWLEHDQPDWRQKLASAPWPRAFLKPAVGATARETLRFHTDAEGLALATAHLERLNRVEDFLLQPYLERVETEGEWSAIFIDGNATHAVQKIPRTGDYRVQDDFGAADRRVTLTTADLARAEAAVRAVPYPVVYARADFLRDSDGNSLLTELELVEPSLFFRHGPEAAEALADALLRRLQ